MGAISQKPFFVRCNKEDDCSLVGKSGTAEEI